MPNTETKSDFNVEVVRITEVKAHPNADRLEQYETTAGYPVLDTKGKYQVGDLAVYVPLSNPAFSFLRSRPDQVTARIGARRLRGIYSEGLLVPYSVLEKPWEEIERDGPVLPMPPEGVDVRDLLKITRYVNPNELREGAGPDGGSLSTARKAMVREMPVYGLDSLVRFKDAIPLGTPVVITEKIHGCNARYMFKDGRLYVGSHKVMRGDTGAPLAAWFKNAWREVKHRFASVFRTSTRGGNLDALNEKGDIWWQIAEQYDLKRRLGSTPSVHGLTFYGEIYGKGLQVRGGVDFCYDSPEGLSFRVFDIWDAKEGVFLSYDAMRRTCGVLGLSSSPRVFEGLWPGTEEMHKRFMYNLPGTDLVMWSIKPRHIREGWVVRTDVSEADPNRKTFKWVSPEYKLLGEK